MISKKDIDDSNVFDWLFVFFGILIFLLYLAVIFQEGFSFLFSPAAHGSLDPCIPHHFILLLGFILIVFPLKYYFKKENQK